MPQNITMDNSDIYDLNEFGWLKKDHPDVLLMEDLFKENKGNAKNFNHLQLMVYANADYFISTHGGTGTLASYFKGINLLYSKKDVQDNINVIMQEADKKISEGVSSSTSNERDLGVRL